jgi:hypothetical protein
MAVPHLLAHLYHTELSPSANYQAEILGMFVNHFFKLAYRVGNEFLCLGCAGGSSIRHAYLQPCAESSHLCKQDIYMVLLSQCTVHCYALAIDFLSIDDP